MYVDIIIVLRPFRCIFPNPIPSTKIVGEAMPNTKIVGEAMPNTKIVGEAGVYYVEVLGASSK